ncbi:MAG: OsmC family protein [Chloroflexi bacterium]|nr:OsmC family protein [Chloroflexota bacterium]
MSHADTSPIKGRYAVRCQSTDVPGRSLAHARTNHWIIDSPSGPNEAVTTGETFMAGIAACGVTLVELHAQQKGLPFGTLEVSAEGVRTEASMPDFARIDVHFAFTGVDREQAAYYVDVWKKH